MTNRILHLIILFLATVPAIAGDSIISRTMNYYPDGREIVCHNGSHRYTRALYGSHTAFRLETSDRPLFAVFRKGACRNLRLALVSPDGKDGRVTPLDSTCFDCEARYLGGRRTYTLRHGSAAIHIYAMASFGSEGAVWRFQTEGLAEGTLLQATLCESRGSKFRRNGDLGVDDLTLFDANPAVPPLASIRWAADGTSYLLLDSDNALAAAPAADTQAQQEARSRFEKEESRRQSIMSGVEFNTPDPVFNVLGSVLMAAADGLWDGDTWQHGCIGWRTPLAGWRGCYVGDAVGWTDRSYRHFAAYAKSQVCDVPPTLPHPQQDTTLNMARAVKRWGTPMYSNGYICRYPNRNNTMHHYDMNINYIDGLLWHLSYDADTVQMREFFPVLQRHLEWEKRNFDPDNDHLYDAYCCIWASDALYYNSGAVTHSSAYNYRANRLAARIAELLHLDPSPYRTEADAILHAINSRLWLPDRGHWAEHQDFMGRKRLHTHAALWSIYTPIDCGAATPLQAYLATRYVDRDIPHIPFRVRGKGSDTLGADTLLFTLSTTDWMPYAWSTNNVAHEEVANMALAYFHAGRSDEGFRLLKSDIIDEMFLGKSPGNFGQISFFDKVVNEAYRDFGDNIGVTSRALINGLFGIQPDALHGRCIVQPAFPDTWHEASIRTPYLSYTFRRDGDKDIYTVRQRFAQPLAITVRTNAGGGAYLDVTGTADSLQTIVIDRTLLPQPIRHTQPAAERDKTASAEYLRRMGLDDITPHAEGRHVYIDLQEAYNANVDDVFRNRYLSPRSPYTTLQIPVQGIGQWCHPEQTAEIEDDGLRHAVTPLPRTPEKGFFDTHRGVSFLIPVSGHNICYTSLFDNYPDATDITIPRRSPYGGTTKGVSAAYLMLAGTTNNMQSRIDNALVIATYDNGERDTLHLENPINWCPVNEAYNYDSHAFWTAARQPLRFRLDNGAVGRDINALAPHAPDTATAAGSGSDLMLGTERDIRHGAGVILKMPLNPKRRLRSLRLETLSNDIVAGIMAVTLERQE